MKNIESNKKLLFEMMKKINPDYKLPINEEKEVPGLDKYLQRSNLSEKEMVELIKDKLDKIVSDPQNEDNDAIPVLFDIIVGKKIKLGSKMLESFNKFMNSLDEFTNDKLYFNTQSEALNFAIDKAHQNGFKIKDEDLQNSKFVQGWVGTENTRSDDLPLYKDDKLQKKMLHIILYRMPSGKYELTSYIN